MKELDDRKNLTVNRMGSRLGKYGRVFYLMLADRIVTWDEIRSHCGLSENQISIGWQQLLRVGLAEGDITHGKSGMIFIESTRNR